MDETPVLELASRALALAKRAGAQSAEASVSIAQRFHAEARDNVVARLEGSTAKSLFLRVFRDGRKATLSTSDLTAGGLEESVSRAVEHAGLVAPDPYAGLPDAFASGASPLELDDPEVSRRDGSEKVEEALDLERLIRAADARVD